MFPTEDADLETYGEDSIDFFVNYLNIDKNPENIQQEFVTLIKCIKNLPNPPDANCERPENFWRKILYRQDITISVDLRRIVNFVFSISISSAGNLIM